MAKTREQIKEEVKALVVGYKDQIDLSKYKYRENGKLWTDVDEMVDNLWFELFEDALTEACEDMLEEYWPEEDEEDF